MTDVWFVTNAGIAKYDKSAIPEHSEAVGALPDISGYGRVYGLRDAMALDDAIDADGNSRLTPHITAIAGRKRAVCVKWWKHSKKQTPMVLLI